MGETAMRTYNLIFVDDESIVRDGISSCISWERNGFSLAGMFENGKQALNFVERNPVDVVITDINMPKMDGLTFSRILSEKYSHIIVLLLTGYDEFEYAQEAVKTHVREFLLKPITADQLAGVLKKTKDELDIIREKNKQQELMTAKLKESFPLLKERFLCKLVSGGLTREEILRRKVYFGWEDFSNYYQVIVLSLPSIWNELETVSFTEFLRKETRSGDEVFFNKDENPIILLQGESPEILREKTLGLTEKAFRFSTLFDKGIIFGGYGDIVADTAALHRGYKEACTAVDYSKLLGLTRIISIANVRERKTISLDDFNGMIRNLLGKLKEGSREQTKAAVEDIFRYLGKHFVTSAEITHYLTRLHLTIHYFLDEMDLLLPDSEFTPHQSALFQSLGHAQDYFIRMISSIENLIQTRRNDMALSRIDRAKEIISLKFRNFDFSLNDICNELYLSTSQFSLLFKEGTGKTFVEYLTSYRIEETKKLLKVSDKKVYEIAEDAGYRDPRYFSLLFKKATGMTPLEYRTHL